MIRKLLPTLGALVLVLGCLGARAMPVDDMSAPRHAIADQMTRGGEYAVQVVEGKRVAAERPRRIAMEIASPQGERAEIYAAQNAALSLGVMGIVALGLGLVALLGRAPSRRVEASAARKTGWRDSLFEMLEADLHNLDSLTHGFSGR